MKKFMLMLTLVLMMCCEAVFAAGFDPNTEPNMVLFYEFEDSVGTDSMQLHDGVVYGDALLVEDAPLQLSLNGMSTKCVDMSIYGSCIVLPGTEGINLQSITVAVWMKGGPAGSWRPIVSKFGEDNQGWQFRRGGEGYGNLSMTLRGKSDADNQSNIVPELTEGLWRHYAATHDATTGVTKYYVQGELFQTKDPVTGTVAPTTSPIAIGVRIKSDLEGSFEWPGEIPALDDVRVYSYALSDAQIAVLCPSPSERANVTAPANGFIGLVDYGTGLIGWNAPAVGIAAEYNVWVKKDVDADWTFAGNVAGTETTIAFPVIMEQGATYQARVDVVDDIGFIIVGDAVSWYSSAMPVITQQPVTSKDPIKVGSNPAFYCRASDPVDAELTYVWYVNGEAVLGTNDAKFVWHDIKAKDHASEVYCEISSVNGSAQSNIVLALVQTCIAQYTFDIPVVTDPNFYDPNDFGIGKESRFAYDCTVVNGIDGLAALSNSTGPDGSNALALNGTANGALIADVMEDSNMHFRDYANRAFITMSMWIKGFPDNDCYIAGMEGGNKGYGFRKMGDDIAWTTRDHDKDGDMLFNFSSYANDGQWHHIVGYFGPNNEWTDGNGYDRGDKALFIDGVQVSAASGDYNRQGIGLEYDETVFAIGCHAWDAVGRGDWAGSANLSIDDVRVYNYALDTTEIAYLAANPGVNPDCMGIDGDVNGDCTVDLNDVDILAQNWLVVN